MARKKNESTNDYKEKYEKKKYCRNLFNVVSEGMQDWEKEETYKDYGARRHKI